jgi:hypothetical protein
MARTTCARWRTTVCQIDFSSADAGYRCGSDDHKDKKNIWKFEIISVE